MSDADKTVYSSQGASGVTGGPDDSSTSGKGPDKGAKRNPLLLIGGIGCVLLLCAALLIGGGAYYFVTSGESSVADLLGGEDDTTTSAPPAEAPTATLTPVPAAASTEADQTGSEAGEPESEEPTPPESDEAAVGEPELGSITFAIGATDDYEPVEPAETFEAGITEIHAIFEYSGMSTDYAWERVWYLDGNEILRSPQEGNPPEAWSGAQAGVFDYFINNNDDPLPSGEWTLEIYVEGEVLSSGSFVIESEEEPELAAADEETEHAADLEPTPTATATSTPPPATSASSGGGTFSLAYTKWDGGQHNLYVADTSGNGERLILGRAAGPSWSADGNTLFFYGEQGVDRQYINGIEYVFDGVSNGVVAMTASPLPSSPDQARLTQGIDWKQGAARWTNVSPDGKMVAFDANFSGDFRIYFLGTDENQQFRFEIIGEQGDWSPDSQRLVYRSGRDGITGIWISNRDDSGHTNITQSGSDSFPAWSPDGRTIAFSRDEGGNVDIYTMSPDGSNLQRLTEAQGPDTLPTFTPTGDIIFRSARSGSWAIWKMSRTGGGQTEIIADAGVGPDWAFSRMDVK
jgi:Tol biopolymer transport system component